MKEEHRQSKRMGKDLQANMFIPKDGGFIEVLGTIENISKKGMGFVITDKDMIKKAMQVIDTNMQVVIQTVDEFVISAYRQEVILEKFRLVWFNYTENRLRMGFELDSENWKWLSYVINNQRESTIVEKIG